MYQPGLISLMNQQSKKVQIKLADGVDRRDEDVKTFLRSLSLEIYANYPKIDDDEIQLWKKVAKVGLHQLNSMNWEVVPAIPSVELTLVPHVTDEKLLYLRPHEAVNVFYTDFSANNVLFDVNIRLSEQSVLIKRVTYTFFDNFVLDLVAFVLFLNCTFHFMINPL